MLTSTIVESIDSTNQIARRLSVISVMKVMRLTVKFLNAKQNEEEINMLTELTVKNNNILMTNHLLTHNMMVSCLLHCITDYCYITNYVKYTIIFFMLVC